MASFYAAGVEELGLYTRLETNMRHFCPIYKFTFLQAHGAICLAAGVPVRALVVLKSLDFDQVCRTLKLLFEGGDLIIPSLRVPLSPR
jgi:hypothetical protein